MCPEEDSNLHALRHCLLKTACIPISPSGHKLRTTNYELRTTTDSIRASLRLTRNRKYGTITLSHFYEKTHSDYQLFSHNTLTSYCVSYLTLVSCEKSFYERFRSLCGSFTRSCLRSSSHNSKCL